MAIMTVATVMLVVGVLAMHDNNTAPSIASNPKYAAGAYHVGRGVAGPSAPADAASALGDGERAGLGLHVVFGLRSSVRRGAGAPRQVTRAEAAAAKARMTRTLEVALNNAVAMRAAATRSGAKRAGSGGKGTRRPEFKASAVGARLQREQKRQHPSPPRVRLMRDAYAAEAEARLRRELPASPPAPRR